MERQRKHSHKRDAILACLRSTKSHPTAEWIYQQLKPAIPDLSLGTVYRNLALFKEEGLICSVGIIDGLEHFDATVRPHAHFVCTKCGRITDLAQIDLPFDLQQQVTAAEGVQIHSYQLQFSGICADCIEE